MKRRKFIITEKDFAKYGIDSHYDLDMSVDWSKGDCLKRKGRKARRRSGKSGHSKTMKTGKTKGVSSIHGSNTGRIIKGMASTTDKDRSKDVITPQAMKEAVNDLVQKGANTVFLNHDTDTPIGRVLKTALKPKGIFVEIMISKAADVEDIWTKIKEGVLNAFSIRLRPKKVEVVEDTDTGRILEFRILSMELFEVSVVGLPMNAKANITSIIEKSFNQSIKRYNTKKRSSGMKNKSKKKGRKSTPAGVLTEDQVKEMIAEANAPVVNALADITALLTEKSVSKKRKSRKKTTSKKKSKKSKSADPMLEVMKQMQETNAALVKSLKRSNRRKGLQDDGQDVDSGIPAKVLKDATDADTVKYCLYASTHQKAYDELTEDEKRIVKGVYVQCIMASESV